MPAKLDRCVKKLMDEGRDEKSAWAICQASINKTTNKGVKMLKKAIVLKSMRTADGANDWVRVMKHKYPNAKVVDSETLKSFGDLGGIPMSPLPGASHVIVEEELAPTVNVIKKGEATSIIKAMVEKGFMKVDKYGPCMTEKWHGMVDEFMSKALKESLKSVDELNYELSDETGEGYASVIGMLGEVMKALEDSEKLANMAPATENADFGHELRSNKPISDEEAGAAFEVEADEAGGDADVRDPKMDGEAVTDEARNTATYEADHNKGQEVRAQPSKNTARKSVEGFDDHMFLTFKSVDEARAWQNPDVGVYQVESVSPSDRKRFGEDAKYVVRGRNNWYEESLVLKSTKADDRTQGLTSPESVSDDGGTEAVEARAKKVDALKSVVEEVLEEVLE